MMKTKGAASPATSEAGSFQEAVAAVSQGLDAEHEENADKVTPTLACSHVRALHRAS